MNSKLRLLLVVGIISTITAIVWAQRQQIADSKKSNPGFGMYHELSAEQMAELKIKKIQLA